MTAHGNNEIVEKQKKIYDYIDFEDSIVECLKNNSYAFRTEELFRFVLGSQKHNQAEKFDGIKWIMENFPDEPLNYNLLCCFYEHLKEGAGWYLEVDNWINIRYRIIADRVIGKKVEINATPLYNNFEYLDFLNKWNLISDLTENQKAIFSEKLNNLSANPIISHTGAIEMEDFEMMTIGSHSVFGIIHFYMNNIERFHDSIGKALLKNI